MSRLIIVSTLMLLVAVSVVVQGHKHSASPLMLLVSFDGFRWDYLTKHSLANFERLKHNGSYADYIFSSFTTGTFPNHWTMVTGLYQESHGVVHNDMYDPLLRKEFHIGAADSQTLEWFGQGGVAGVEPIWTTNQRAGEDRRSAAEWAGAKVVFNNQSIVYVPYNHSQPFKDLVDLFIGMYTRESEPINFGALYFDEPDATGHRYGPNSEEMAQKLRELDDTLGYLIGELQSHHLYDKLNLIVSSDHGMEDVSKDKSIDLTAYVDVKLFNSYGSAACLNLFMINLADLDDVYVKLKQVPNVDVFKHDEIPAALNYKNNRRIGDIVVFAHVGYAVVLPQHPVDFETKKGDHGYDNNASSMHPIFIAHGPGFKKGVRVEPFNNVDIYPLMCYLLGINPGPNNGSLQRVVDMLVLKQVNDSHGFVFFSLAIIPVTIILFSVVLVWISKRESQSSGFKDNVNCEYHTVATSETALVVENMDLDSDERVRPIGNNLSPNSRN